MEAKNFLKKLEEWFYWFWLVKYKLTILLTLLVILYWLISAYTIKKESQPDIKYWLISIVTVQVWVNPVDIDNSITQKIETEIKDVDWIKKITSNSRLGVSSVVVEFQNWIEISKALNDIKDKVDKVNLPNDAEDPLVEDIWTNVNIMYKAVFYWDDKQFPKDKLIDLVENLKKEVEWKWWINKFEIDWWSDFDWYILIDKDKLETIWLNIQDIGWLITSFSKNYPIWNYKIWDLNYDFRIEWENNTLKEFLEIPIKNWENNIIKLKDISQIRREYDNDSIEKIWFYNKFWYNAITANLEKTDWANVFNSAKTSKLLLEEKLKEAKYQWLNVSYMQDLSEEISKDFKDLRSNLIQTLLIVFIVLIIFSWFKEAFVALTLLPMAFLSTFALLNFLWLSLNFLTNFSFILALWIAIDTTIVIIEWTSHKIRQWFSVKNAILLSIYDYKRPLISWTATTLVALAPMMFLPWIMWKYLAYIPITLFWVLTFALIYSLTLNSWIFYVLYKDKKYYENKHDDELSDYEKEIVEQDRIWKTLINQENIWIRTKVLDRMWVVYNLIMRHFLKTRFIRLSIIFWSILSVILSIFVLSQWIWFELFPSWDNNRLDMSIEWKKWTDTKIMWNLLSDIENNLSKYQEIEEYTITVQDEIISIAIELYDKKERIKKNQLDSFQLEEKLLENLNYLNQIGYNVESKVLKWWPPQESQVWIKLIADDNQKFKQLINISKDFEKFFTDYNWLKNITNSSTDNPWQFVFDIKKDELIKLWLNPWQIISEIVWAINWINVWSINVNWEDRNIKIKFQQFDEKLIPSEFLNMSINTTKWKIKLSEILDYKIDNSIDTILREDTNITINVWADIENDFKMENWKKLQVSDVETKLDEFTKKYNFPNWITFSKWWENQENSDLIVATLTSFWIAVFLIFTILVLQFNSFAQPLIIIFVIYMWILWANLWLYLTWNPYSLPFWIWFVSLTWIIVNDAILLVDTINRKLSKMQDKLKWIIASWRERVEPILVTTLTTVGWVLPLAFQDIFWAWLAYTIVFWLLTWTVVTLFVVPILYYECFVEWWLYKRLFYGFFSWIFKFIIKYYKILILILLVIAIWFAINYFFK